MKTKVYIASPYTKGDVALNVKRQLDMADQLMTLGYAPFAPLYSHFQHMAHPRPYTDWIEIDLEWVPACDVVLRLDGESSGADGEVAFAQQHGVSVVYSVAELLASFPPASGVAGLDAVTADAERLCWALRPLVRLVPAGSGECWVRFKVGSQEFTIGNQSLAEDEAAHFAGLFVFALAGAFRTLPAGVQEAPDGR